MKQIIKYFLFAATIIICSPPLMAYETCKIENQSGTSEFSWCSKHHQKGSIRCYAEIKNSSGEKSKIWSQGCYDSYSDCWWSGKGAVKPNDEDCKIKNQACKIENQSGTSEFSWCSKHHQKGSIRCYAEVKYSDGTKDKIWGKTCYDSYSDCWWSEKGHVEPDCVK